MPAIFGKSSCPNGEVFKISKPSAYAVIKPYSIPLCTILTKCPLPAGPVCISPPSGASVFRAGSMIAYASGAPPTIRQ